MSSSGARILSRARKTSPACAGHQQRAPLPAPAATPLLTRPRGRACPAPGARQLGTLPQARCSRGAAKSQPSAPRNLTKAWPLSIRHLALRAETRATIAGCATSHMRRSPAKRGGTHAKAPVPLALVASPLETATHRCTTHGQCHTCPSQGPRHTCPAHSPRQKCPAQGACNKCPAQGACHTCRARSGRSKQPQYAACCAREASDFLHASTAVCRCMCTARNPTCHLARL